MNQEEALSAFAALSQETRLSIVRLLVVAGSDGLAAGDIAARVGASTTASSFHLKELERAGLITQRRVSRNIFYNAQYSALSGLIQFLMEDCCGGHPEVCKSPVLTSDPSCCIPKTEN
jgi:ArsR family transcriptional regulator